MKLKTWIAAAALFLMLSCALFTGPREVVEGLSPELSGYNSVSP